MSERRDSTGPPVTGRTATLRLPPDRSSVATARRFVTRFCRAAGLPDSVCDTATLLASELVSNAVVHGRTPATLQVRRPGALLRVEVCDDSPALPVPGRAPPLDAEGGRGLLIVARLADRWGVDAVGRGKSVWFELGIPGVSSAGRRPDRAR